MEFGKPMDEIKIPERQLPNRKEYRRLMKTGKDEEGHEANVQDVKLLRRATLGDLVAFGVEVNKATQGLKDYIDRISSNNNYALLKLVDFLEKEGVLKESAGDRFDAFMVELAKQEIEKVKEAKEAEEAKKEKTSPQDDDTPTPNNPKVITIDEIRKRNAEKSK